ALDEKRFEEAVKYFQEAARLQDDSQTRDLLQQAQNAWVESRRAAYEQAMLRGRQAVKERKYLDAAAAFRDALGQLPEDKDAAAALQEAEFRGSLERGRAALQNKQYPDAIRVFAEAVNKRPEDQESRSLLKEAREQQRLQLMGQGKAALNARQYAE